MTERQRLCAEGHSLRCLLLLICVAGAELDVVDLLGRTPLMVAIREGHHANFLTLLKEVRLASCKFTRGQLPHGQRLDLLLPIDSQSFSPVGR